MARSERGNAGTRVPGRCNYLGRKVGTQRAAHCLAAEAGVSVADVLCLQERVPEARGHILRFRVCIVAPVAQVRVGRGVLPLDCFCGDPVLASDWSCCWRCRWRSCCGGWAGVCRAAQCRFQIRKGRHCRAMHRSRKPGIASKHQLSRRQDHHDEAVYRGGAAQHVRWSNQPRCVCTRLHQFPRSRYARSARRGEHEGGR